MEWTPVFKKFATKEEKQTFTEVAEKYKSRAKNYRTNSNSKKLFEGLFSEEDKKTLDLIYSNLLCDYITVGSIIYTKQGEVILQPEKKWSNIFIGVSPIKLKDILEDNVIVEPKYSVLNLNRQNSKEDE